MLSPSTKHTIRETLVRSPAPKLITEFAKRYFQLEVLNQQRLPKHKDGNVMFVMNHTAFFGLEVYLVGSMLYANDPSLEMRTLVWEGFSEGPLGEWFTTLGAETAKIGRGVELLMDDKSVLIMPEGVDATDVRNKLNVFHTGYLRMIQGALAEGKSIDIVPIGFSGVDESIPWWVTNNEFLVNKVMKGVDPSFDFFLLPKLPAPRPTKIVFNVGEPISLSSDDLATEEKLKARNHIILDEIESLMDEAASHRQEKINNNPVNYWYHKLIAGQISRLPF